MERRDYNWEASGSLTPDLEGSPHSGVHKKRAERRAEKLPDQGEKRPERGISVPDLNSEL